MNKNKRRAYLRAGIVALGLTTVLACANRKKAEVIWDVSFPRIGSQSSPRAADLNDDGVLDIIMGAGLNEYQPSDYGVLALDGATGSVLWKAESEDQVYGSPSLNDVTGDGIADVFIGGRSPQFRALDGKDGTLLWRYEFQYEMHPVLRHARFNFNNAAWVPDQNGDGYPELLTVNGGNSKAAPYSLQDRYPGVMMLFDSRSGKILAADTMPDGNESYMSPLCYTQEDSDDPVIVFGTGGETISGKLYRARLSDLLAGKLSAARAIASDDGHGFIAPPVVADLNHDGVSDIVAISHGSTVFAIDGKNNALLWRRTIPGTESSNSFGVGNFTGDETPDLFTFVSRGEWPNSTGSVQVLLDGRDGALTYVDSIGCTGFSSPVIYDLNNDGWDEAIISVNEYDCSLGFSGESPRMIENKLIVLDFRAASVQIVDQQPGFKNIFTTPWIGDLDDDGYLDIVHGLYFHHGNLLNFLGMRMKRIATPIKMRGPVVWGAYMGSRGDAVYAP